MPPKNAVARDLGALELLRDPSTGEVFTGCCGYKLINFTEGSDIRFTFQPNDPSQPETARVTVILTQKAGNPARLVETERFDVLWEGCREGATVCREYRPLLEKVLGLVRENESKASFLCPGRTDLPLNQRIPAQARLLGDLCAFSVCVEDFYPFFLILLAFLLLFPFLLVFEIAQEHRRSKLILTLLVLVSFLARWTLATFGPEDNDPDIVKGGDRGVVVSLFGGLLTLFSTHSVPLLVYANMVVGSLSPAIFYLTIRLLKVAYPMDVLSALLFSLHPLLVRFSGGCGAANYVVFFALVSLWASLMYVETRRIPALLLGVFACGLCIGSRPGGVLVVPLVCSAVLLVKGFDWKTCIIIALAGISFFALTGVPRGDFVDFIIEQGFVYPWAWLTPSRVVWLAPYLTPIVDIVFFFFGLFHLFRSNKRLVVWALSNLVLCAGLFANHPVNGPEFANARYQAITLIPFFIVLAFGVEPLVRFFNKGTVRLLCAGLLGGFFFGQAVVVSLAVTKPTTLDHEFTFLQEALPMLPHNAEIYHVSPATNYLLDHHGFRGFLSTSLLVERPDIRWHEWSENQNIPLEGCPKFAYLRAICNLDGKKVEEIMADRDMTNEQCMTLLGESSKNQCVRFFCQHREDIVMGRSVEGRTFARDEYRYPVVWIGIFRL